MNRNRKRSRIVAEFKPRLEGELYIDEERLEAFGKDRSIYQIVPLAVVVPASLEDIQSVITFAAAEALSVTPGVAAPERRGSVWGRESWWHYSETVF